MLPVACYGDLFDWSPAIISAGIPGGIWDIDGCAEWYGWAEEKKGKDMGLSWQWKVVERRSFADHWELFAIEPKFRLWYALFSQSPWWMPSINVPFLPYFVLFALNLLVVPYILQQNVFTFTLLLILNLQLILFLSFVALFAPLHFSTLLVIYFRPMHLHFFSPLMLSHLLVFISTGSSQCGFVTCPSVHCFHFIT